MKVIATSITNSGGNINLDFLKIDVDYNEVLNPPLKIKSGLIKIKSGLTRIP